MMRKKVRRVAIGIAGGAVLLVGIIAIPYPGPGWLIVFSGLAILATEFAWARKVLHFAKGKYDAWRDWLKIQPPITRIAILILTGAIVLATLWLLNVFGLLGGWMQLPIDWLRSPLFP